MKLDTMKLDFIIQKTDIKTQKIEKSGVKIFKIVITSFSL